MGRIPPWVYALGLFLFIQSLYIGPIEEQLTWMNVLTITVCLLGGCWSLLISWYSVHALVLGSGSARDDILFILLSVLNFVATFGGLYYQLSRMDHDAFNPYGPMSTISSIYFSLVTFATVGYGDISPKTDSARFLVSLQIALAMVYTVVVFSVAGSLVFRSASTIVKKDDDSTPKD